MHGSVSTTGPLIWGLLVLGILTCGLALLLAVDALRRPSQAFATVPAPPWPVIGAGGGPPPASAAPWPGRFTDLGAPTSPGVRTLPVGHFPGPGLARTAWTGQLQTDVSRTGTIGIFIPGISSIGHGPGRSSRMSGRVWQVHRIGGKSARF